MVLHSGEILLRGHVEGYTLFNIIQRPPNCLSNPQCLPSFTGNPLTLLKSCMYVVNNLYYCVVVTGLRRNSLLPRERRPCGGSYARIIPRRLSAHGLPYLYLSHSSDPGSANCVGLSYRGGGRNERTHTLAYRLPIHAEVHASSGVSHKSSPRT